MGMHRPTPTGTKRDILRLLAREPLGPASIADKLQLAVPHVDQHLVSLAQYDYVQRLDGPADSEQSSVYTLGSAARGVLPKRYDLMLKALLPTVTSQLSADELSSLLRRVGARVAEEMDAGARALPPGPRREKALTWIESSFAWQAEVTAESEDHLLIAVHSCLLHEVATLPEEACAEFFAELLGSLCGTHVQPVPTRGSSACCKLKLLRKAPQIDGGREV
jgi:predicted ArsR family transcriptional regulator